MASKVPEDWPEFKARVQASLSSAEPYDCAVYGALERRGIHALIPAKVEPIRSRVPLRRFRYDAKHDILRCPRKRVLRPTRPIRHGRFFYSKAKSLSENIRRDYKVFGA
jgi:hypothetical protein